MSILNKLTEGIVNRDLSRDGDALLSKWEKTGLLEGLDDYQRNTMSVLLENQAKELLRESNTMEGGSVEGFAAVAFPIVRRVFGGLLAQKLVSVQPMSLPSGLIFFMDFVKQNSQIAGGMANRDNLQTGQTPSVYGGNVRGREILTSGVEIDPDERADAEQTPQFQDLIQGHSAARGQATTAANVAFSIGGAAAVDGVHDITLDGSVSDADAKALSFDADLLARSDSEIASVCRISFDLTAGANEPMSRMVRPDIRHLVADPTTVSSGRLVRRLSRIVAESATSITLELVFLDDAVVPAGIVDASQLDVQFAMADRIEAATSAANPNGANTDTLGALVGATAWEMEGSQDLPEIDIKVDSVAVTSVTRKLKATWTPELAQDLNAYHNLDAEVELTGILSEQIALEIDQEILADLIAGAKASTLYWSRRPGLFVNRLTGADATSLAAPPDFTGSVSEWYETLVETINDVSADIHRKTLRGGANFLVCGPEVANILEFTSGFRASVTADDDTGSVGAQQVGSISKKWDLYVDPYFPRNVVLVGRKGSSFLESGYVYAPYVPLQTTPTIFHADDFTPRKAVMTRYGKKLVRPDMYGLVVDRDLEG